MADVDSDIARISALIAKGELVAAGEAVRALLAVYPKDPFAYWLHSEIETGSGRHAEAVTAAARARELAPHNPRFAVNYARCLLFAGQKAAATAAAVQAGELTLDAATHDALGTILTHCEEPRRAIQHFERAVAWDPLNATFRFNLASTQRMLGHAQAAEESLDDVISMRPEDGYAYLARAHLKTHTQDNNHVRQMAKVYARLNQGSAKIALGYALAKELEDLGEFSKSFAYLSESAGDMRRSFQYNVADDVETMQHLMQMQHGLSHNGGSDSEEPIFIVGLPRSGTTLVDQIVTSHPDVYGAGEINAFAGVAVRAATAEAQKGRLSKREFAYHINRVPGRALGDAYVAATRPRTGRTPRFTDKTPINYLYIGLIRRALPQAKMLALRRHPIDVCYAMFKMLFVGNYPFSYDLLELAKYYVAWHQLMKHWEALAESSLLTVEYERLVQSQEDTTRRIIGHCNLSWDARCLYFHRHGGPITSASAGQADRPLYGSSVGKWRHYQNELEPLISYLDSHGIVTN